MHSDILILLTGVSTIVIALVTLINLMLNLAGNYKITKVQTQTNSLMDKLVLEVRAAAIAKGILDERKRVAKKLSDDASL